MKSIFLIALCVLGVSFHTFSQTVQAPVTAEQRADEVVEKMKTALTLTDDQIPKIKGITLDRINKVTDARKQYGADKQRVQSANKQAFSQWEDQLKGILSLEQYNKYVETKSQY